MNNAKLVDFLNSWAEGVIKIGQAFLDETNYKKVAMDFLSQHYAFKTQQVLFKPTFTRENVFRNDLDAALSYFIGGKFSEDNGFALRPWETIKLQELNILNEENLSTAMGTL